VDGVRARGPGQRPLFHHRRAAGAALLGRLEQQAHAAAQAARRRARLQQARGCARAAGQGLSCVVDGGVADGVACVGGAKMTIILLFLLLK